MKIGLDSAVSATQTASVTRWARPRSPHLLLLRRRRRPLRRLLKTKRTKSQSRNGVIIGKGTKEGRRIENEQRNWDGDVGERKGGRVPERRRKETERTS